MALQEELMLAQMYTHAWAIVVVIILMAMSVQSSQWKNSTVPITVFSVLTVLTAVATALSMAMHAGFDQDGVHKNEALADAEIVSVTVAMAMAVITFVVFWGLAGGAAPFQTSPLFGYLLFGLVVSAFGMGFLYFRASSFRQEHKKAVNDRGGVEGYSSKLEKWGFYHIQWHLVGGMFAFLLAICLYIVLKTKYQSEQA